MNSMRCRRLIRGVLTICIITCTPSTVVAHAQGTVPDYARAASLRNRVQNRVVQAVRDLAWSKDGDYLYYRRSGSAGAIEIVSVETATGRRQPAFDHAALVEVLSDDGFDPVDVEHLPIASIEAEEDGGLLLFIRQNDRQLVVRSAATGLHVVEDVADSLGGLEARAPSSRIRSGSSSRDTSITFENRTDGPVRLFWVDGQGGRRVYATIEPGQVHTQHTFESHAWLVTTVDESPLVMFVATERPAAAVITGVVERSERRGQNRSSRAGANRSTNGLFEVSIKDHNVVLRNVETGDERQLTQDGSADDAYGGRVHWSPDRSRFIVMQTIPAQERLVHYVESAPTDQLQPRLQSYQYLKPGDRIARPRPRMFDATTGSGIPIDTRLFDNPWRLTQFHWAPDSSRFFFLYNQRGHQVMRLISIDAETGDASAVIDEQCETFFDYSNKTLLRHFDESDEVLWMSERDGWNHLYLIDRTTGEATRQVTSGEWVVRSVERVDVERGKVWLGVMGIHPDQDPYHIHFVRVGLTTSDLTVLTDGDGTHSIEYSPDGRFIIDTYSRVDLPPATELRRVDDGELVCDLGQDDWSQLIETGWNPPERFVAKGRDGRTDIYGVVFRPTNFDASLTYPIIESIYAGPHGHHVPKSFRPYYSEQALAELGFVVVKIDGMGTNWRSKAFHDYCWKNIADAGFPDRKLWIQAAAMQHPHMDASRVGIYGGSAGGQNAMRALLDHHDLYDVAIADCGCHDNRMDKIWWNEAWMGWPVDESYARSSNVDDAHKLQGHLLLTVGEADRNVDPASTMQVVKALIAADKDFDLIVFPGSGHGAGGSRYGRQRMYDFFVRHLHGVEPRN